MSFTLITIEKERQGKQRPWSQHTFSFCTTVTKNFNQKMTLKSQQLNKSQKDNTVVVSCDFLVLPTDSCSCPERRRDTEKRFFSIVILLFRKIIMGPAQHDFIIFYGFKTIWHDLLHLFESIFFQTISLFS